MNKIIIRDKNLIGLAAGILIVLVIVFGPVLTLLKSRLSTQKTLKKQLTSLEEKKTILNGIDKQQIGERVKKMEAVFPSKKPVVELMSSLSKLASQYGLSFGGITLSPGELGEEDKAKSAKAKKSPINADLHDLRFGFEVGGDFDKISSFLKALENTAPLMRVEKVALTIKSVPILDRLLTLVVAKIDVAAYFQPPPASLGAVTKPIMLLTRKDEVVLERLFNFQTFEAVIPVAPVGQQDLFGQGVQL